MVEQVGLMSCPQPVVVSRLDNRMQDGPALPCNATISLPERIGAPALSLSPAELAAMRGQGAVRNPIALCDRADLTPVGIGQMDRSAPLAKASCATAGLAAAQDKMTLTIATVNNGDMIRVQGLTDELTAANPGIAVKWVTLDENIMRERVTTDIATRFL